VAAKRNICFGKNSTTVEKKTKKQKPPEKPAPGEGNLEATKRGDPPAKQLASNHKAAALSQSGSSTRRRDVSVGPDPPIFRTEYHEQD